jgi:hypothetical protein
VPFEYVVCADGHHPYSTPLMLAMVQITHSRVS